MSEMQSPENESNSTAGSAVAIGPLSKQDKSSDWSWLTDNPIIIKQARVRLKRSSIISTMMIVGVLASAVIWMEFQFNTKRYDRSAGYILGGMVFLLLIIGSQMLGVMINSTRATGMIDFHRLSPQSSRSLLFGFLFGGPIREYLVVLFAVPFLILACVLYGTPLLGLFQLILALFMMTQLMHGLTVISAMLVRSPSPTAPKGAAWGLIASMGMLGPMMTGTMAVDRLAGDPMKVSFYGVTFPWPLLFAMIATIPVAFFLIAGVRRFHDDNMPSLTKKQAMLAFGCAIFVGLGLLFGLFLPQERFIKVFELIVIGVWMLISFILIATASPERVAYIGGLRRSLRLGLRRPGPFQDRALNRWTLLIMAVSMAFGVAMMNFIRRSEYANLDALPGPTSATAVLVVLEFGLAMQYFRLRLGKHAGGGLALFLFVAWFMPFMLGMAVTLAGSMEEASIGLVIMSLSPLFGVPLGSGGVEFTEAPVRACQLASLVPTLAAVFIFNQMISSLQRRIDWRILPEHQQPATDPFAWMDEASAKDLVSRKKKSG